MDDAMQVQLAEGARRWQSNEISMGEAFRQYGLCLRRDESCTLQVNDHIGVFAGVLGRIAYADDDAIVVVPL